MTTASLAATSAARRRKRRRVKRVGALTAVLLGAGAVVASLSSSVPSVTTDPPEPVPVVPVDPPPPEPAEPPEPVWPYGAFHGGPHGTTVGFTMFRGNPTRTFYGFGPIPFDPAVLWRYPDRPMCSIEGDLDDGGRSWCGIGWTGQPLIHLLADGRLEVVVGGYDGAVHFVDAATGRASRRAFMTGAMVKGTESLDPDGFPLLYTGSRDGYFRIVALDRDHPSELWRLGRHPQGVWNNDWDANPTVLDDVLYLAGEDGWFRVIRLNRGYDRDGVVTVAPTILLEVPGFNDELFRLIGDRNVSIESSPAVTDDAIYWANSGGRVMGIDRRKALQGELKIVLDVWVGDDTDASLVVDRDGMLYVAVEEERRLPHAQALGQLLKLDPGRPEQPIVWQLAIPGVDGVSGPSGGPGDGGVWATPALYDGWLYVPTHAGDLLVVDRFTGTVVWRERIGYHEWSSPAVVAAPNGDVHLIVGTCNTPGVRAYALTDPKQPRELWRVSLPGCVESTPIVWDGRIYVGSRDGFLYAIG
jgi:outer membrane protein assembly factor BamB